MVTLEEAFQGSKRTVSLRRGNSNKVETYQVKIPKGVHEGQRIRLAGQGEAGAGGGKSGDLFLRVRLARHPDFTVEGSDLIHEVKIDPWQAVDRERIAGADAGGKRPFEIACRGRSPDSDFDCAATDFQPRRGRAVIYSSCRRFRFRKN